MLWIHGPGGVGDEVPLEAKKGGSFREPLSTILLTIVLGPGLRALIKKGHREERHVLRCSNGEEGEWFAGVGTWVQFAGVSAAAAA